MPAVDLTAARVPIYAEPGDAVTVAVTVPSGYETGTWTAPIYRDSSLGTVLGSFHAAAVGQVVTVSASAAELAALVPTHPQFSAFWCLIRTASSQQRTWLKGDLVIDAGRFVPRNNAQALAVTVNAGAVVATATALVAVGQFVKVVYLTTAVSGALADGWYYRSGLPAVFTGRTWSVAWEGTAAQVPPQGAGDAQVQAGDLVITRTSTL